MLYTSTRDNKIEITCAEAIVKGLSAEGGLFLPRSIPSLSLTELGALANMGYVDRAAHILSKFLTSAGGWEPGEIQQCAHKA